MKSYVLFPLTFIALFCLALVQPTVTLYAPEKVQEEFNLGNIRKTNEVWTGEIPCEGAFKCFDTEVHARDAVENLLKGYWYRYKINTVHEVLMRYSPPWENDTAALIKNVCLYMNVTSFQELDMLDPAVLDNLAQGIINNEGTI